MKRNLTITLAIVFVLSMFMANVSKMDSAPETRVLLEQHTGTWCGWCPDGSVVMDALLEKYGSKLIGVKLHNGDAMVIQEETDIGQLNGVGFPSGTVNRVVFNDGQGSSFMFMGRGTWEGAIDALLKQAAPVEVTLKYSINPKTRELTAMIDASFFQSVNDEVRFNMIVCEDEVTGSGAGYDQKNYFSNNSQYPSHPYYKLANPIVGYKHMKVARGFAGGTWGTPNSIGTSANSGSKYSYTYKLTLGTGINLDKVWCVGLVQKFNSTDATKLNILNSVVGTKGSLTTELTSSDQEKQAKNKDELAEMNLVLKNVSTKSINYSWKLEKSTRTPADWTYSLENITGDITVAPSEQKDLRLLLTPGATVGVGDVTLKIWDKADANGFSYSRKLTVVSNEIENFQVIDDGENGAKSIKTELAAANLGKYYDVPSEDFVGAFASLTNIKIVVWTTGEEGGISGEEGTVLSSLLQSDVPVLLNGQQALNSLRTSGTGLLSTFGIRYDAVCAQGQSSGNITLKGYANDPITNGFSQPCVLKKYLTFTMSISNPSIATPILKHDIKTDSIVAVRSQLYNSRAVFLGINPMIVGNTAARNGLIKKSIEWMLAGQQQSGPKMALSTKEIQYDKVNVGESKDLYFTITNNGDKDLIINEVSNDNVKDVNHVFTFVDLDTPPITIAPEGTYNVKIKFTPKKKSFYEADIVVKSNSIETPDEIISLYGEGNETESVNDEAVSQTGNFRFSATPNPAVTNSVIRYTLNGNDVKNIEFRLIDINGKDISTLLNTSVVPGTYSLDFNAGNLASGNYIIVANVDGETLKLPLIIVR